MLMTPCKVCFALVYVAQMDLHREWHMNLSNVPRPELSPVAQAMAFPNKEN